MTETGRRNVKPAQSYYRFHAAAKYAAGHYLMTSGLPYLILLPGRLTDEPASHRIRTVRDGDEDIFAS